MVHDPVEQGDDKYNSFLSSMFILRADASATEMLILLLYFNSSSIGFIVCTISFERPVNYLCEAWHVFPPKYEAWTHFNN